MRPHSRSRSVVWPRHVVAAVAAACLAFACRSETEFGKEAVWPRPKSGAVVSEHPLATQVGIAVLDRGGNAADAAVATALALAVVYPQAGNLGGGGFALWVPHQGEPVCIDFRERAPAAARAAVYLDKDGARVAERSLHGPFAVAVPGSPAGLVDLLESAGSRSLSLEELCRPAIDLARKGFSVDAWLARDLAQPGVKASFNDAARELFYPRGNALREGDVLVQPDLARTLEGLARDGARGFFGGPVATALVQEIARAPIPALEKDGATGAGWITLEDLSRYRTVRRAPLKGWFRGIEILTVPPPSSGGIVLLQMLGVLEGLPLETERIQSARQHQLEVSQGGRAKSDDPGLSERMVHWWIEAARSAFADRAEHLGDPDFVNVPTDALLSSHWIADRRVQIGERANLRVEPWKPVAREGFQTTHLAVLDKRGNACSLTTTLNTTFGSGILVRGGGFLLNNEMDDFAIQAQSPNVFGLVGGAANCVEPLKRPLSSMAPTVLRDGGHVNVMVLGSPGGPRIISAIAQVLLRILVLEESLSEAIRAPRMHQQWNPAATTFEPGFDPLIIAALAERRGHEVERGTQRFASVQAIRLLTPGGTPEAFSDPRRGGVGAVQGEPAQTAARPTASGAPSASEFPR